MFGDEVEIHAGLIGELQDFEMVPVKIDVGTRRIVVLLHVVEQSEFHGDDSYFAPACSFWISCSKELSNIFSSASFLTSALPSARKSMIEVKPASDT